MTDQKPDTAPQVDLEAERSRAADEARQAERQRVADLKAAFADDPAFALEQIESGAGVQQAQAAYADVLRTRLAEAQATIDDLTDQLAEVTGKADAPSTGAQAVESGDGEEDGQGNFLEQARALAEEKGITKVEAMRRLAKDNPELYAASRGRTA